MKNTIIFLSLLVVLVGGTIYLTFQKTELAPVISTVATTTTTTTTPSKTLTTYTNQDPDFSFNYPADFNLDEGTRPSFEGNWSSLSQATGTVYATLTLPRSFQPGTNFSEATVSFAGSTNATTTCTDLPNDMQIKSEVVQIGGQEFIKVEVADAGAGNFYQTTVYRRLVSDTCLSIESTIHSTNIGVYDPGTVKEFDQTKTAALLWTVVNSLKFN